MDFYQPTTPFGRRSLTYGHIAVQAAAREAPTGKAAHKWNVFRDICAVKARLGVSDRALAVLNALLSFHQETVLTGAGLIVFPSNRNLAIRANGMAPATLRRHLAALVDAGLIIRRDSPNGKRYARKGRDGEIACAFGFDLAPLVARADEFAGLAESQREQDLAARLLRERITLCRRDIVKMIAAGLQGDASGGQGWDDQLGAYRKLAEELARASGAEELSRIAKDLETLALGIRKRLENQTILKNSSANESQPERHKQNSNTQSQNESEPSTEKKRAGGETQRFPLTTVLRACPDVALYARNGISNWNDLIAAVDGVVRPSLGVSPSAWEGARATMGEIPAAIAVAAILQRAEKISSAGGYLRDLTRRAAEGRFSIGPMLMALLKPDGGSQARRLREVDPKPVAPPLISPRHLG